MSKLNYPILTEEQEDQIYAENPNLRLKTMCYEDDGVEFAVIFKSASRASLGSYTTALGTVSMQEASKSTYQAAHEGFAKTNVLWPDTPTLHALFEEYPALAFKVANSINEHSGSNFKEKKRR